MKESIGDDMIRASGSAGFAGPVGATLERTVVRHLEKPLGTCLPSCLPVRDVPEGIWWSQTTLRKDKNGGPAWTRRLWRPVLYQLSYGPRTATTI